MSYIINCNVKTLCYSPDGKYIAGGCFAGNIYIWDAITKNIYRVLEHNDSIYSVCYSHDGKYLASGGHDHTIKVWELANGMYRMFHTNHPIYSMCFSADDSYLASHTSYEILLWDMKTWKCSELPTRPMLSSPLCFSPTDKNQLAFCTWGNSAIRIWNTETKIKVSEMVNYHWQTNALCYSPDGKYIVSGSDDGEIRLWEIKTGQDIATLSGQDIAPIVSVCFSSDGKYLASGSSANKIRIWDIASKRTISIFSGHTNDIACMCFSPDGKYLASCANDNTIRLWDIDKEKRLIISALQDKNSILGIFLSRGLYDPRLLNIICKS